MYGCFNYDGTNPTYSSANANCKKLSRSGGSMYIFGNESNLAKDKLDGVDLAVQRPHPGLGRLGVGFRHPFFHRLGRTVDEVFRLLEAQARDFAHRLDDVDLVVANGGQHHGELGLFLRRRGGRSGGRPCHGDRRGSRHAKLVFHVLDELRELKDGHLADLFQNLCSFHCLLQ